MAYKATTNAKDKNNKVCKTDMKGGRPVTPVEVAAFAL